MSDPLTARRSPVGGFGRPPKPLPRWLLPLLALLVAAGAVAFFVLLAGAGEARAWQIFLVNFLLWSGMAMAGVALAAIFQVTKARWATPVKRVGVACAAYLPVSFLLFLGTWFGRHSLFPSAEHPRPLIASWMNMSSLFTREAILLLVLYGLGLLYSYRFLRADADRPASGNPQPASLRALAVVLLLVYAYVYTVFSWDFVMSLHPTWVSTLFGGYYFIGNLYLGLATVIALTIYVRWRYNLEDSMDPRIFHKLGKLLFSFSLLWIYLFWSQYLVIWYGNLPREIGYVLTRTSQSPWSSLSLVVLAINFVVPFVILLSRPAKENRRVLLAMSVAIVMGMWMERFLLVVPSLAPQAPVPLGLAELLITAGFFASFALTYLTTLHKIPIIVKDKL